MGENLSASSYDAYVTIIVLLFLVVALASGYGFYKLSKWMGERSGIS